MKTGGVRRGAQVAIKRAFFVVFLTFSALSSSVALAQDFTFGGFRVEGNSRVESPTILSYLGIQVGQSVSASEVNDGVQRIRETGLFESVDAVPSGNTLVIRVVEFPTISRINFEGNSKLPDDQLAALVESQPRRVFNPAAAERDAAAIAAAYATEGRINATVTPQIIRRADNRVDLVFEIFEGGVTEVERISFVGNRSFGDFRLRQVLETKQAGLLRAIISRDTVIAERIEFDKSLLTDFYQSRGYIDFQILSVDVALTRSRDAYLVTYNIQEGQRYSFNTATVTSEIEGLDAAEYLDALRLRAGSTYSPVTIENNINRLEQVALRQGVPFVSIDPRISRNDRELTLDVNFVLVRGPRVFVERIDIEGNNTTLDRVIRSQFRVVEGDPLNARSIRQSAERIRALGFFSNADVETRRGSADDQIIIDVNVTEQPTGTLSFGANYNSDTGFSLVASLKEQNFLGRGQRLNAEISTAETNRTLSFDFYEPNLLGRDLGFGLNFGYRITDNENASFDTERFNLSPSLSFAVGEQSRMRVNFGLSYTDIYDVTTASAPIVADGVVGGLWSTTVGYDFSWDSRINGLNPDLGVLLRFGQDFGFGDSTFIRTTALAMAETYVFNENVTLRATVEGGLLSYSEGASRITDRFSLGSRYMRGFEAGGIGPRDAITGDALGGNAFAVARLEAEFPLGLPEEYNITGGVFVDYGSLWDTGLADLTDVDYNSAIPRTVVGVSLFWTTPIGPLRFNWTEAIDAQADDIPRNFDLTIQTSF